MSKLFVVATFDTKGEEAAYVRDCLKAAGAETVTLDVGAKGPPVGVPDVARESVADRHPQGRKILDIPDRGAAVRAMSEALVVYLRAAHARGEVAGVLGMGGSGGTSLIAPALQALPIGLPKILVSTVASGDTRPFVGTSDVTMMYSVVDVAGLNRVSKRILANAAHALAGMTKWTPPAVAEKPTVAMTMFGVTTPCVNAVRHTLEADGHDCLVFHATGTGGLAMESLIRAGMIDGVLDLTTTETADEIAGGVFTAGPTRFDAVCETGIPCVMSLGACDMVNFGARETVPEKFKDRKLHIHNAAVTLMRTTPDECRRIAAFIASKINRYRGPFALLIPELGVSAIDAPGQPFHDPTADAALFDELTARFEPAPNRRLECLPLHINDPAFADRAVAVYRELVQTAKQKAAS